MTLRRDINREHETAVIDAAVRAHNTRTATSFEVEARPDPPDAILFDGTMRTWIEHTDAFYPGWARDLTSFAARDRKHHPLHRGIHVDMDARFAMEFCRVVQQKLENRSYAKVVAELGPGILVVGLESPWLAEDTIETINDHWRQLGSPDLSSVFAYVYLGYRADDANQAVPWQPT